MKTLHLTVTLLATLLFSNVNFAQVNKPGKVVINEYMPWPSASCGTTGEFVELMNFGPGSADISCYILTDGDFAITIPSGTILQPGEFYLLAAQNTLSQPCGNFDSTVTVDLNWNTCGCTSGTIPTTGNGFMTDGATASEQLVLMDANTNVIDAVRRTTSESSSNITSSGIGVCSPRTFDLDTKTFTYETIGTTAGRGNTFARLADGDCAWVRESSQSANATNNTSGDESDISYELDIIDPDNCGFMLGSIEIHVKHSDYSSVFPMSYTYAYDSDNDGDFDGSDFYAYGTDNSPPSISIVGLLTGRYRITVSSSGGCYLHTFEFTILSCSSVLPVKLEYFKLTEKGKSPKFEWQLSDADDLEKIELQKSSDGKNFTDHAEVPKKQEKGLQTYRYTATGNSSDYYRLRIKTNTDRVLYSNTLVNRNTVETNSLVCWPMPVQNTLFVSVSSVSDEVASYRILTSNGISVVEGKWSLSPGSQTKMINVDQIPAGLYQLVVTQNNRREFYKVIKL